MGDIAELSEKLTKLVFMALDHGVDSVREGGPLMPFLMSSEGGGISMRRFFSELLEEAAALARRYAAQLPGTVQLAAFAYDGYITIDGRKSDAIMVEGYERGMSQSVVFGQRYQPAADGKKLELLGNPAYLGTAQALFH